MWKVQAPVVLHAYIYKSRACKSKHAIVLSSFQTIYWCKKPVAEGRTQQEMSQWLVMWPCSIMKTTVWIPTVSVTRTFSGWDALVVNTTVGRAMKSSEKVKWSSPANCVYCMQTRTQVQYIWLCSFFLYFVSRSKLISPLTVIQSEQSALVNYIAVAVLRLYLPVCNENFCCSDVPILPPVFDTVGILIDNE